MIMRMMTRRDGMGFLAVNVMIPGVHFQLFLDLSDI